MLATIGALPEVPKRLHMIFQSKEIVNDDSMMVQHGIRRMIDMNPEWTWTVYDDEAVDACVATTC